jgi:hypothetical protein
MATQVSRIYGALLPPQTAVNMIYAILTQEDIVRAIEGENPISIISRDGRMIAFTKETTPPCKIIYERDIIIQVLEHLNFDLKEIDISGPVLVFNHFYNNGYYIESVNFDIITDAYHKAYGNNEPFVPENT